MTFDELDNAVTFVHLVIPIIEEFGGSITSFFRSATHNKAVGGVADSDHLSGKAIDVVLDDKMNARQFAQRC